MIEQINIALEQKGPGISQPGSVKPAVGDNVREKRAYTSIKSDREWTSAFTSEQVDIVNSLNYGGIAVIELQFSLRKAVTDCVLALSQTK